MRESSIKIKLTEKLGFFAFSTGSNVVYQFKSLYYLFFLTNVLKIDVLTAGTILTIGTVWDAVNDPIIGFWALNRKFKSGERIRPFAKWFALPWALSVVALFTDFGLPSKLCVVFCVVVYIVFELFYTFIAIPYNSMASLATDSDSQRRSINVWRNLGGCLGSGIGAVACLPLLKLFGGLDEKGNLSAGSKKGFFLAALVMGAVCIAGSLIHYYTTRERIKPINETASPLGAKEVFKMLFSCSSWVKNMIYILLYGVNNLLLMSLITYYATYVIGSTAMATPIQAVYLIFSVLSSFLVTPIDKKLGRRRTMMLVALVMVLGKIWFVINPFSMGAIYLNAVSVGFGATVAFVMFNTNRNNIVDIIERKNGRRLDSLVSTADNLSSKLAVALATQLIALWLKIAGFDASLALQPTKAISAINAMLGWVPMAVAAGMFIVVSGIRIEEESSSPAG